LIFACAVVVSSGVVSSLEPDTEVARYVGGHLVVIRSQQRPDGWELHRKVAWDPLTLPGNVFVVKQVLVSSSKRPIEVRKNGQVRRLKPREVLIVLG